MEPKNQLETLQALENDVTEGPWKAQDGQIDGGGGTIAHNVNWLPNASFIVASRDAMPQLRRIVEMADEALTALFVRQGDEPPESRIEHAKELGEDTLSAIAAFKVGVAQE